MDSGAAVSVLNSKIFKQLYSPKLEKCNRILHALGQQQIPVLGELHTVAKCGNKLASFVLIVENVENSKNLLGLHLFKIFNFEIQQISNVSKKQGTHFTDLRKKYKEVFKPANGTLKDFKASTYLKPNSVLKLYKSRPIHFPNWTNSKRKRSDSQKQEFGSI